MSALLMLVLLGSQAPATAPQPFHARGWDPAWKLTIVDGKVTYEEAGNTPISLASPTVANEDGVLEYVAGDFRVSIVPIACTDPTSGRRYGDSVMISLPPERRGAVGALRGLP